jgi:hypothetical protein
MTKIVAFLNLIISALAVLFSKLSNNYFKLVSLILQFDITLGVCCSLQ